ncbi:MAG: hypothetical protein BWZ02_01127 [Lentisphaerae bacterium ADurb.BinA184]|nr:MAG: hypothetical protein BWZ02_01127 [Lentisphaerae bacterium ADurb.BinA184]
MFAGLAFFLAVACGRAAAQDSALNAIDAHLERIALFSSAVRGQQAAIDVCGRQSAEALALYQAAVAAGRSDDLPSLESACQTTATLLNHYMQRLIDTQQKLASEYDALAGKYRGGEQPGLAEPNYVSAGATWEKTADAVAAQAEEFSRDGSLDSAGATFERAAGLAERARNSWQQAFVCARALGSAANDLTYESRAAAALATQRHLLRNAVKSYYNAYQQHKLQAAADRSDVASQQIGEGWLTAAASHAQYERLAQRLAGLPE